MKSQSNTRPDRAEARSGRIPACEDRRSAGTRASDPEIRLRVRLTGVVQGMGFRPAMYRLARTVGLVGWVANDAEGAMAELEGRGSLVHDLLNRLQTDLPPGVRPEAIHLESVPILGDASFRIVPSRERGHKTLAIPPDLAMCRQCRAEVMNPTDRRFRYGFIACVRCGPRYSVLRDVPYDRERTTLAHFPLCEACRHEYDDPDDRRYHAESMVCPACGPRVTLEDAGGSAEAWGEAAVEGACEIIRKGAILAVKGVGGFQLWVDARSQHAVQRLRDRKRRTDKPLAVLFPSMTAIGNACDVPAAAAALLRSPAAPIVLLSRKPGALLADAVAPGLRTVGAMLPSSPLHHLLMRELDAPVVATSGNRSEEPLATTNEEARERLHCIADRFLQHDRPIARPIDDSVVRWSEEGPIVIRRARGYVPQTLTVTHTDPTGPPVPTLGFGGHLKNTVAFGEGNRILVSQHVGDLTTVEAVRSYREIIADLTRLLDREPGLLACDLHPDYHSTRVAEAVAAQRGVPLVHVQHHHAHVAACLAEHGLTGRVLGVVWDGSGYGSDGTLWGGEFLIASLEDAVRHAHFHPLRLIGGEAALRDTRRAALSALWEVLGEETPRDLARRWTDWASHGRGLVALLRTGAGPVSSSAGRLFDVVAALIGVSGRNTYEGQAALLVEQAAEEFSRGRAAATPDAMTRYDIPLRGGPGCESLVADWRPLVRAVLRDVEDRVETGRIAYAFHGALAELVVRVARDAKLPRVVLSGGCFQNVLLRRLVQQRLRAAGFEVHGHVRLPPNDGGLAVGQVMVAAARIRRRDS